MRPVSACEPGQSRPRPKPGGPGPSKLRYRLSRAWAKPAVRSALTVYLPLAVLGIIGWRLAANDAVRGSVETRLAAMAESLATRPEFAVHGLQMTGASPGLRAAITRAADLAPGVSSLKLDLDAIRARVEALGPVAGARVRLAPEGFLEIAVEERVARVLWRSRAGGLALVDGTGVTIGTVGARADRPDLPLVLGNGAPGRVAEALELIAAAPDLMPRIRALVLVGERRWNLVLAGGVTVMLPEKRPASALARVMEVHRTEDLFERDISAVDMRLPDRPTLRLRPRALETYRARQGVPEES